MAHDAEDEDEQGQMEAVKREGAVGDEADATFDGKRDGRQRAVE